MTNPRRGPFAGERGDSALTTLSIVLAAIGGSALDFCECGGIAQADWTCCRCHRLLCAKCATLLDVGDDKPCARICDECLLMVITAGEVAVADDASEGSVQP